MRWYIVFGCRPRGFFFMIQQRIAFPALRDRRISSMSSVLRRCACRTSSSRSLVNSPVRRPKRTPLRKLKKYSRLVCSTPGMFHLPWQPAVCSNDRQRNDWAAKGIPRQCRSKLWSCFSESQRIWTSIWRRWRSSLLLYSSISRHRRYQRHARLDVWVVCCSSPQIFYFQVLDRLYR